MITNSYSIRNNAAWLNFLSAAFELHNRQNCNIFALLRCCSDSEQKASSIRLTFSDVQISCALVLAGDLSNADSDGAMKIQWSDA